MHRRQTRNEDIPIKIGGWNGKFVVDHNSAPRIIQHKNDSSTYEPRDQHDSPASAAPKYATGNKFFGYHTETEKLPVVWDGTFVGPQYRRNPVSLNPDDLPKMFMVPTLTTHVYLNFHPFRATATAPTLTSSSPTTRKRRCCPHNGVASSSWTQTMCEWSQSETTATSGIMRMNGTLSRPKRELRWTGKSPSRRRAVMMLCGRMTETLAKPDGMESSSWTRTI